MSEADICRTCAACCFDVVVPPFEEDELVLLPFTLQEPIRAAWWLASNPESEYWRLQDRVCDWLDRETLLCGHYDLRPKACRQTRVGDLRCQSARTRAGVSVSVPLTIERESAND